MATAETKKTLEREYIIPLRKFWLRAPKHKRAKKAIRVIKEFLAKHMKAEFDDVKVEKWLNNEMWRKGITSPPAKVKVKVTKDEKGIVRAELVDLPEFAKKIEAKLKAKSETVKEKKKAEKAKEDVEKDKEAAAKKEANETPEEKEKKAEEKIIDKKVKLEDKAHVPKDEHMHVKTKIMRTD
jgi:large subunit ribosomal protein L31e